MCNSYGREAGVRGGSSCMYFTPPDFLTIFLDLYNGSVRQDLDKK